MFFFNNKRELKSRQIRAIKMKTINYEFKNAKRCLQIIIVVCELIKNKINKNQNK